MDISFKKIRHILSSFALVLGFISLNAQYVPIEEVITGETLVIPITSFGGSPTGFAKHGTVTKTYLGGTSYELHYTPDSGYIGLDTLNTNFWTSPGNISHSLHYINVILSKVTAESDYAVTDESVPVEVNVLANDFSSEGTLTLEGIPNVANGFSFIIPDSTIYFQPDPGFIGFASLNYAVCDPLGTCDIGTLTISVTDGNPLNGNDSVYVNTLVNTPLALPLSHLGYEIVDDPDNGSINFISGGVIEYTPDQDFVGNDDFLLKKLYDGVYYYRHFFVEVLQHQNTNKVAFDDFAFTAINTAIDVNVTNNDLGNHVIKSFTQPDVAEGTVTKTTAHTLEFTPATDFVGPAEFTYKINLGPGKFETATVTVTVDDQEPQDEPFELYTNKNTTLILYYNAPLSYTEFDVANNPNHGQLEYIDTDTTISIGSQSIDVSNVMLYHPDIDFVGEDEFEIDYCVTVNNTCYLTKILVHVLDVGSELCAGEDCVWPGDNNNDGIANMLDILFLGKGIGEYGAARTNPVMEWYGQFADEWGKSFAFSEDMKHLDSDGNGEVNEDDLSALDEFYNRTHHIHPEINPFEKKDPIILVPTFTPPLKIGDLATYDIYLGETGNEAINMYGITYSFGYDPNFVDESSINVDFIEDSWLLTNNNSPALTLVKNLDLLTRVDIGLTRTNGYSVSGAGKVATLDFIVDDDLDIRADEGIITFPINLNNIIGLDENGNYFKLPDFETKVEIQFGGDRIETKEEQLVLFPNPTRDYLSLHLNGDEYINQLEIFSMSGAQLFDSGKVEWERAELSVESYSNGLYVARATLSDGSIINKKFQIAK